MWISVPCGCGGSVGYSCCHCGGLGFTWRISTTEMKAQSDHQCIGWMHCPLCHVHIHRGNFLSHVLITHQTTWDAIERFVASMISVSPQERSGHQPAGHRISGNSLKRMSNELNLAIEYLIPRHNFVRLAKSLRLPKLHAHSDEAKSNHASLKQVFRGFAHRLRII